MQIREMNLKELDKIYEIVKQLRVELSFDEFDDLIYDMRHMEYKMIGLMEGERLITFAGVAVQTNLYHKRHLYIFELVTDAKERQKGYAKEMLLYLQDYAKMAMCEHLILSQEDSLPSKWCEKYGFIKGRSLYSKKVEIGAL